MTFIVNPDLETYAAEHSSPADPLLQELFRVTHEETDDPIMLTGPLEGGFLRLMVKAIGACRALEVGMFTGYGTLNIAAGLPDNGSIVTCELNPKYVAIARRFFAKSPHGRKIEILEGEARKTLAKLEPPFDFAFIDADKTNYDHYYEEALRLLRPGGIIAVDNVLWFGRVLDPQDDSTRAIHALNEKIAADARVEAVLLTVRDGVQLVRKLS